MTNDETWTSGWSCSGLWRAEIYRQAKKNAAYSAAAAEVTPPPAEAYYDEPPAAAPEDDVISQLERLGALHAQGILTDEEFAAQKSEAAQLLILCSLGQHPELSFSREGGLASPRQIK